MYWNAFIIIMFIVGIIQTIQNCRFFIGASVHILFVFSRNSKRKSCQPFYRNIYTLNLCLFKRNLSLMMQQSNATKLWIRWFKLSIPRSSPSGRRSEYCFIIIPSVHRGLCCRSDYCNNKYPAKVYTWQPLRVTHPRTLNTAKQTKSHASLHLF